MMKPTRTTRQGTRLISAQALRRTVGGFQTMPELDANGNAVANWMLEIEGVTQGRTLIKQA